MTATRPTKATFLLVASRDSSLCAHCGGGIYGVRGLDFSLHHRRPAGAGGDRTSEGHAPGNLVLLHGHGASLCHGYIESQRTYAVEVGLLVRRPALPSQTPIKHAVHGWCLLADDGSVAAVPTMTNPHAA